MTPSAEDKSSAPKSPGEPARVHPDSRLTPAQAEELRHQLLEMRERLVRGHEDHLDRGRFNAEAIPEAEEAAALDTSQSTLLDLAESERILLAKVDRALAKMRSGTYGVSEESEEPIGFDRLRAIPWAALNVVDQERLEREQRGRRG
jgi:DnaK suppressor protein